jgi:hypothetical protein
MSVDGPGIPNETTDVPDENENGRDAERMGPK